MLLLVLLSVCLSHSFAGVPAGTLLTHTSPPRPLCNTLHAQLVTHTRTLLLPCCTPAPGPTRPVSYTAYGAAAGSQAAWQAMPSMAGAGARGVAGGGRSPGAYGGREGRPDRRDRTAPRVRQPAGRVCWTCAKTVNTLGSVMCRLFGRSPRHSCTLVAWFVAYSGVGSVTASCVGVVAKGSCLCAPRTCLAALYPAAVCAGMCCMCAVCVLPSTGPQPAPEACWWGAGALPQPHKEARVCRCVWAVGCRKGNRRNTLPHHQRARLICQCSCRACICICTCNRSDRARSHIHESAHA